MQPKLTIQERLKDLRVERSLTLEQLLRKQAFQSLRWENTKPMILRTSARSAWWSWQSSTACPPITCWG